MPTSGRDRATSNDESLDAGRAGEALDLMQRALSLIDSNGGPADVGAHLDLAIHRLRDWMDESSK